MCGCVTFGLGVAIGVADITGFVGIGLVVATDLLVSEDFFTLVAWSASIFGFAELACLVD